MVMQANKKSLNLSGRDNNRRSIRPPCPSVSSAVQKSADQRYRVTESYPQGGTGIPAGEIDYIYYDSQWQAIETRTNGTAASNVSSQMVWSAAYINAAILQDSYTAGTLQPNSRLYFLQDANWNTTAIVNFINAAWQVLQYYVYSPYGTITVLNEDGAGSTPIVNNLYQGMTLDPVTGLYYARNRNYSPTLGRWINQDPAGYINGANTYQFVMSNPVNRVDPEGLQVVSGWGWANQQGELQQARSEVEAARKEAMKEIMPCAQAEAKVLGDALSLLDDLIDSFPEDEPVSEVPVAEAGMASPPLSAPPSGAPATPAPSGAAASAPDVNFNPLVYDLAELGRAIQDAEKLCHTECHVGGGGSGPQPKSGSNPWPFPPT